MEPNLSYEPPFWDDEDATPTSPTPTLGSTAISKVYLGTTEVPKLYLGTTKVYDKDA